MPGQGVPQGATLVTLPKGATLITLPMGATPVKPEELPQPGLSPRLEMVERPDEKLLDERQQEAARILASYFSPGGAGFPVSTPPKPKTMVDRILAEKEQAQTLQIQSAGLAPTRAQMPRAPVAQPSSTAVAIEDPEAEPPEAKLEKAVMSFKSGAADLADLAGGGMIWAGFEETGQQLRDYADSVIQENELKEFYQEFTWGDLSDPDFYLTKGVRIIPSMLTLIPAAVAGGMVGSTVGTAFGLGRLGVGIVAAVSSAVASRPLESAMEAAGTFNSLTDQGYAPEQAAEGAAETFTKNMALIGMDAAQYALAFAKVPAPLRSGMATWIRKVGVKAVGFAVGATSEGYEEVLQGYFQELGEQAVNGQVDASLLEALKLSGPEVKEAFVLGTMGGAMFQATGLAKQALTPKDMDNIIDEQIENAGGPTGKEGEDAKAIRGLPRPADQAGRAGEAGQVKGGEVVREGVREEPPAPERPKKAEVAAQPPGTRKEAAIEREKLLLQQSQEQDAILKAKAAEYKVGAAAPVAPVVAGVEKAGAGVLPPAKPEKPAPGGVQGVKEPWEIGPEDVDMALATRAFEWTSHTPEKRAETVRSDYVRDMTSITERLTILAETDEQRVLLNEELTRFKGNYLKHMNAWLQAHSQTASSMITGPANFPVERNRKKLESERRRMEEWIEWKKKAERSIEKKLIGARTPEQAETVEFKRLERKIIDSVASIRSIDSGEVKGFNRQLFTTSIAGLIKRAADSGNIGAAQRALDMVREIQSKMDKPIFAKNNSIWTYIEKAGKRIKEAPTGEEIVKQYEGVSIIRNYDDNRTRIFFDTKPDEQMRKALRGAGWKWSPSNDAWQRMNTRASIQSAEMILADYPELKPAEKPETKGAAVPDVLITEQATKLYAAAGPIDPELVRASIREAQSFVIATKKVVERNVRRGTTHMRKLGEGGVQLARDIDEITFNVHREANNDALDIREIMKGLTAKERTRVAMVADNEIPANTQTERVVERAERLRKVLDRQLEEFAAVGGQRRLGGPGGKKVPAGGGGHAFPQVPNKEGRAVLKELSTGTMTPRVVQAAEWLVENGKADNIDAAVQQLARFRDEQLRSTNPYFERTRTPLPTYLREWDPHKVLSGIMERNWTTIEGMRKWGWDEKGVSFPMADEMIGKIAQEYPFDAERVHQFIQSSFGLGSRASPESQRISRDLRSVQFIGKIAMSPLTITRNMIDRFAKAYTTAGLSITARATLKFPPFLNVFINSSRRIKEQMIRSGAVFGHGSIAEGVEPGTIVMGMIGKPFTASERGNQVFEALVAKMKLERDIQLYLEAKPDSRLGVIFKTIQNLGENTEAQITERIEEAGLAGKTTEELVDILAKSKGADMAPIQVQAVLHRAVRDQAFPVILSTKRLWWDSSPMMKVLAQFKVWPIEQVGFIYRSALKQAIKGHIVPLMRFIIGVIIAGELYNIARDRVYDKEEALITNLRRRPDKHNPKDIAWILYKDALDGGLIGMFADLTWGITDWVLGPTAGTIGELGKTMISALRRPGLTVHALKKAMRREVSAVRQAEGIMNKIGVLIGRDSERAVLYNRWRFRSNEYWREKNVGLFERVEKTIMGPPSYPAGKNALVYELISRNITANDVEGATKYIEILFSEKDTPEERRKLWTGLKQSRGRRSPLGPVALKNRSEFLGSFSKKDQDEANKLQRAWIVDYSKAIKNATIPALAAGAGGKR